MGIEELLVEFFKKSLQEEEHYMDNVMALLRGCRRLLGVDGIFVYGCKVTHDGYELICQNMAKGVEPVPEFLNFNEKDSYRKSVIHYDKNNVRAFTDEKEASGLTYALIQNGQFIGSVGFTDYSVPNRQWTAEERDAIIKIGKALSNLVQRVYLEKEKEVLQSQKEVEANLRQQMQSANNLMNAMAVDTYVIIYVIDLQTGIVKANTPRIQNMQLDILPQTWDRYLQMTLSSVSMNDKDVAYRNLCMESLRAFEIGTSLPPVHFSVKKDPVTKKASEREYFYTVRAKIIVPKHLAVVFTTDDTEILEREQRYKQDLAYALERANEASLAKSAFLSNMSHDIRTPMNAILGFTTIAQAHQDNQEKVADCLDKISSSGNHLLSLINDILDMSRIESGKTVLDEKPCSLSELVHGINAIIQPQLLSKNIDYNVNIAGVENEEICADKLRLNQICLNLLSNAVKYTEVGDKVSFRIVQLPCEEYGFGTYEIRVSDTGRGMSKEFVEHIFEPFSRAQDSTASGIPGTGLGMTILKNIVDMMGGTISVTSELGKGSEFVVKVNLKLLYPEGEPADNNPFCGLRVLVVDDDLDTCESMTQMLMKIGVRAEWCRFGEEALKRVIKAKEERDQYFSYMVDYRMPDMDGIEVTRRIRELVGPDIPIVMLTAYDWSGIESEARESGVSEFYGKPLFQSDLRYILMKAAKVLNEEVVEEKPAYEFGGKRVLLVEDNELNREVAKDLLEDMGLIIEEAQDGSIAVDMIEQKDAHYYDLVLMDIQMPIMNGYEATRRIRRLPDLTKACVPIVAMTANAFEEDKKMALSCGMEAHIAKPIEISKLIATLERVLT